MPNYQFRCQHCRTREDRIISYSEIELQRCDGCAELLVWEFVPTRAKPLFGPKKRARAIRDRNLIELGDASPGEVDSEMSRFRREHEELQEQELQKEALGIAEELGDDLYTRERA